MRACQAIPPVLGRNLRKKFRRETGETVVALDDVSIEVPHGGLAALVGPDGAGKTTLIRLIAGLMPPMPERSRSMASTWRAEPQQVQDRIAYMPQRFGLYEDLTVQENLDLYASLHGITGEERAGAIRELMEMTDLGRLHRPARRPSVRRHEAEAWACLHA